MSTFSERIATNFIFSSQIKLNPFKLFPSRQKNIYHNPAVGANEGTPIFFPN
jgi:hypothetical protein